MRLFKDDFGIAIGSAALLALTLASAAQASPTPPAAPPAAPGAPGDTCSMKLKTLQFAGTFDWKNIRTGKIEKLRFVIGAPEAGTATGGSAVAQIWSGQRCQASCSSVDLGMARADLSMPISLDLQCRGEELGALSARVAVLWGQGTQAETTLRFGSWVDGYEQAALKVEVDRFSAPRLAKSDR